MSQANQGMGKKGTKEWVSKSLNTQEGCPYICKYPCYGRLIRRKKEDVWKNPIFKEEWENQALENYDMGFLANCMYPSIHDIYPENQERALKFILRVMHETDNILLVTSKANFDTIKFLCEHLTEFKHRIRFMITITSRYSDVAFKWEPYAPIIAERLNCLSYLNAHYWQFNVSIEPFLDKNPLFLVRDILYHYPMVQTIWIGCMSTRNYEFHTYQNLLLIQEQLKFFEPELRAKIFLKNSFIDKIEKYRGYLPK